MRSLTYGLSLNLPNMSSTAVIVRMKYKLTSPQDIPSNMHAGTLSTGQSASRWKVNSAELPRKIYVKHVAVTHDTRIGSNDDMVRSIISTSSVNTSPAIGALNIPAIAPAAPHPMSSMSVRLSSLNACPRLLPMAEPVSTIGASAPTEPPNPMVIADATTDDQQLWPLSRLRLLLMASSILVIP